MSKPRYLPDEPLPPYAYVPGRWPHPYSDPRGHSYQRPAPKPQVPDPASWSACREYLQGLDLFNHGYYWEAHEAWEGLWHACGRRGLLADFFKGLIQLAVVGVKVREGRREGVRNHARRAAALFQQIAEAEPSTPVCMGLAIADLLTAAATCAAVPLDPDGKLPVVLRPHQDP